MHRGSPLCYELVAHLLGKGEVCEAGAVQVPQLHPAVFALQATPASVAGGDPRPTLHLTLYRRQRFIVHVIPPLLLWVCLVRLHVTKEEELGHRTGGRFLTCTEVQVKSHLPPCSAEAGSVSWSDRAPRMDIVRYPPT